MLVWHYRWFPLSSVLLSLPPSFLLHSPEAINLSVIVVWELLTVGRVFVWSPKSLWLQSFSIFTTWGHLRRSCKESFQYYSDALCCCWIKLCLSPCLLREGFNLYTLPQIKDKSCVRRDKVVHFGIFFLINVARAAAIESFGNWVFYQLFCRLTKYLDKE